MTLLTLLAGTAALSLAMLFAWALQRWTRNAGWVDVVWSFATGAVGVAYALTPGPGVPLRKAALALLIGLWSLRLGLHIAARTWPGGEDSRYAQFRHDWGAGFERRMVRFLQIQAAAAALLAAAVLLAARNPAPLGLDDLAGVLVLAAAITGGSDCGRTVAAFPQQSRQSWPHLRSRPVAPVAASELLLRVARLGGLSVIRHRLAR